MGRRALRHCRRATRSPQGIAAARSGWPVLETRRGAFSTIWEQAGPLRNLLLTSKVRGSHVVDNEMPFQIKRAYEKAARNDGCRVLVDRIWPRGVTKAEAKIDQWCKAVAPSTALRKWFAHDPARWLEFKRRYFGELAAQRDPLNELHKLASARMVTLVFGARDMEHNQAVALKEHLERRA